MENDRYLVRRVGGGGRTRKVAHEQLRRAPNPGQQMTVSAEVHASNDDMEAPHDVHTSRTRSSSTDTASEAAVLIQDETLHPENIAIVRRRCPSSTDTADEIFETSSTDTAAETEVSTDTASEQCDEIQ